MGDGSETVFPGDLRTLARQDVGAVFWREPLSRHSSWRIGGPADLMVEPSRADQIARVIKFVDRAGIPLVVIGGGTNLLFSDEGVRGVVLKIGRNLSRRAIQGRKLWAEAGAWVPAIVRAAGRAGLTGLEHAIGIPGTLGGLIAMNGGSRRMGIGDSVRRVWVVDRQGTERCLAQEECRFGYRTSALPPSGWVAVAAEMEFVLDDPRRIRREMLAILRERRGKFPLKEPTCGSVFLSEPEQYRSVGPPGKVIEQCGLKGLRVGDAMVAHQHANFILNLGQARTGDVLELIRSIRTIVLESTGSLLMCEVRYLTPDGRIVQAHEVLTG